MYVMNFFKDWYWLVCEWLDVFVKFFEEIVFEDVDEDMGVCVDCV